MGDKGIRPQPKAPELGAFPLDHFRECRTEIETYYRCLRANNSLAPMCREEVKLYLACRMDRGLMRKADMEAFGIPETEFVPMKQRKEDLRRQYEKAGMGQISTVWEHNYKRPNDMDVNDGFERPKKATGS